jgi:uncharacterized protein
MHRAAELAHDLAYDLCVLTGDYRERTHCDWRPCLEGVARLCEALRGDIYAVLGNHDSIAMVPDLEALGIRMLLNECIAIDRGGASMYLAGEDGRHATPSPRRLDKQSALPLAGRARVAPR